MTPLCQLATAKTASAVRVVAFLKVIRTVMTWVPLGTEVEFHGKATEVVPPAKSYGGTRSVWRGKPAMDGLSSQNSTTEVSLCSGAVKT